MSLARLEQTPAVSPEYRRKEAVARLPNTNILALIGMIISLWLGAAGFLVMTSTWLLINLRVIKNPESQRIKLKGL